MTKASNKTNTLNSDINPTGIEALDQMLYGGLPRSANVLLAGNSGTGKTILAMEWLFRGYEKYKEPGVYISLTEPISKTLINSRKLDFYKEENVGPMQIYFTDLRGIMKGLNLENKEFDRKDVGTVVEAVVNMIKQSGAKRVVLDSITAIAYRLRDRDLIRNFIFQLGTELSNLDTNIIMTSEVTGDGYSVFGVEEFIADGIITLKQEIKGHIQERKLAINKMRGIDYDSHPASFRITKGGISLFPRYRHELVYKTFETRMPTGLSGLDKMTQGGYLKGSTVLITGASGTGKTLISLQCVTQALKKGKKVVYYAMEESREQLIRSAKMFGWKLEQYEKKGKLKIMPIFAENLYLEEHIQAIQTACEEIEADLIIVDSLSALANVFSVDALRDFIARLNGYLKIKGITTLFTNATSGLLGANEITDAQLSTITDHIIMLRFVEVESTLKHMLLVLKMRGSDHDKKLRELSFGKKGLEVESDFKGLEGVLGGAPRGVTKIMQDELKTLFTDSMGNMGKRIYEKERGAKTEMTEESLKKLIKELRSKGVVKAKEEKELLKKIKKITE